MKKHHPEQQDDEIYLGNVPTGQEHRFVGWERVRFGVTALDADGHTVPDYRPAFVPADEVREVMARTPESAQNILRTMLEIGSADVYGGPKEDNKR